MGNLYFGCLRFLLAVVFLIPSISFAETIPATQTTAPPVAGPRVQVSSTWHATAQSACNYEIWGVATTPVKVGNIGAGQDQYRCQRNSDGLVYPNPLMTTEMLCTVGTLSGNQCVGVWQCPDSSWTLQGNQCFRADCPSGTVWNEISQTCRCENGSDVGDNGQCCPQPGEALAQMQKCEVYSTSATTCQSSNENGCAIRCNQVQFQIPPNITGGDGVQITDGIPALGQMCKYTGSKANAIDRLGSPLEDDEHAKEDDQTKPKPPPKTPEGCMAAGMGYVTSSTGSTTCVKSGSAGEMVKNSKGSGSESGTGPSGPKPGTNSESNKSESKGPGGETKSRESVTTNNADGSKTTKTTETKCVNGVCEKSETIETRDKDGNLVDSNTKKESGTKDDFCVKNPNDLACKKQDSKFSGDCEKGFVCEGDAANCAVAQATWRLSCDSRKRDDLNDLGDDVIAGNDGMSVSDIPVLSITLQQLPADGPGGACPSLPPLPGGRVLDTAVACTVLQGVGNAGVALSLLLAGFIVIGGVRGL